jgi:predicted NBD/HSP70 family sugar kinase
MRLAKGPEAPSIQDAAGTLAVARAFLALRNLGPMRRSDLRSQIRASTSTVTQAVGALLERQFIMELGHASAMGGRPPVLLDIAPTLGGVLVADVGGSPMRFAAADLRGTIVSSRSVTPTGPGHGREQLMVELEKVKRDLSGPLRAIGLSVDGGLRPDGQPFSTIGALGTRSDADLRSRIDEFGAPVVVERAANAAAFGEYVRGAAVGTNVSMFLGLGTRIGAGLVVGGQPFRGANGAAGDIGLSHLELGHRKGPLLRTQLDQEAAAPALITAYKRLNPSPLKDAAQLFELATHGHQVAKQITDNALECLAITIANSVLLINPECVVLGGLLAMAGDLLVAPLRERVSRMLTMDAPNIVLSRFIFDAPLVGASALAAQLATDQLVRELEGKVDDHN